MVVTRWVLKHGRKCQGKSIPPHDYMSGIYPDLDTLNYTSAVLTSLKYIYRDDVLIHYCTFWDQCC